MVSAEQRIVDQNGNGVILKWIRKNINDRWGLDIQFGRDSNDVERFASDPTIRTKTFTFFTDLDNDENSADLPVVSVPARSIIKALVLEVIEGFSGTGITGIDASIGSSNSIIEIDGQDISVAGFTSVFTNDLVTDEAVFTVDIQSTGANLDQLEQGQLAIHVHYETLP